MTGDTMTDDRDRVAPAAARGRAVRVVRTVLLDVAAAGGAICIVLVVLAFVFHVSLIMFRTGSMSPTIPTGSLAVVHEIPASKAEVGDVVTVTRKGELPITHRVVSTKPAGGGRTSLVLQGDANATPDPAPYVVKNVRLVWWSAPGLAYVVAWFDSPIVIGVVTLAVGALVVWVLWPSRRGEHRDEVRDRDESRPRDEGREHEGAVT